MTYDAHENSVSSGKPVELYEFRQGSNVWRYTSADSLLSYLGVDYIPAVISGGDISYSPEITKSGIEVEVPRTNPVAELFRPQPPGQLVSLTILQKHRADAETVAIWVGRIINCTFTSVTAVLKSESASTSKLRAGLRRSYGPSCPHVLYQSGCHVNSLAYKITDVVGSVSGNVINVTAAAAQPDGYYDGGYIYWQNLAGVIDYRMIDTHVGGVLTLMFSVYGLVAGDTVDLYPGCNRTLSECGTKFSNTDNHGGWMFRPTINPFNGATIF